MPLSDYGPSQAARASRRSLLSGVRGSSPIEKGGPEEPPSPNRLFSVSVVRRNALLPRPVVRLERVVRGTIGAIFAIAPLDVSIAAIRGSRCRLIGNDAT